MIDTVICGFSHRQNACDYNDFVAKSNIIL